MTRRWEDNTETTTPANSRLDIIGFTLALDTQLVTLTRRNFLRALYAFFAVDLDKGTATVRELVRLAALASRYGQIYQVMRPSARALYSAYAGSGRRSDDSAGTGYDS